MSSNILCFPRLPGLSPDLGRDLARAVTWLRLPAGSDALGCGMQAEGVRILRSGSVRIERPMAQGGTVVIDRITGRPGGALEPAFLFAPRNGAPLRAIAETDLDLMCLPAQATGDLLARSAEFRGLVFRACSERMADMLAHAQGGAIS